jgi:uncharacterized RDD family membrane protein YckC
VNEQDQARAAYAGLVTRAVAIGIDLVVADGLAVLFAGAVNLIASLFGHKASLNLGEILAGGVAWFIWVGLYFIIFWTITGQTIGSRILGIRVVAGDGGDLRFRPAIRRFFAMLLAALPLGAGFVRVLFDDRRRGFHDRVADTVVRWEGRPPGRKRAQETDQVIEAGAVIVRPADALPRPAADPAPTRHS